MGMHYGAKDYDVLERQISSTMIGGLMFSVLLSAVCVFLTPWLLRLIRTQEEVLPIATGYLRIIFCGLIFTFIYNLCEHIAGTWRQQIAALFSDDQRCTQCGGRPVFRGGARLGQQRMCLFDGAKRGTLLSAVGLYIKKKVKILCLGRKWRVFDRRLFYKTVQFGWVSAMQQATVQLGKIGIRRLSIQWESLSWRRLQS